MLNEISYKDVLSPAFQQFMKKYKSYQNEGYYVNFTNLPEDRLMDKSPNPKPSHGDPSGVYAYPLSYVLNYPADIKYGLGAKYLRVVKDTSKKTLYINSEDAYSNNAYLINKMTGIPTHKTKEYMDMYLKKYPNKAKSKNKYAKALFGIINLDPEKNFAQRSGMEQRDMLLKAGYDSVFDFSKNEKDAVINSNEPNQAIFLTPDSFEIVEYFDISGGYQGDELSGISISKRLAPKIGEMIALTINDTIKESDSSFEHYKYFTEKGREIEVIFDYIGEIRWDKIFTTGKKHKEYKKDFPYSLEVKISSEKGNINAEYDKSIKNLYDSISEQWEYIKDRKDIDGWIPRSKKYYQDIIDRKAKEEKEKQNQSDLNYFNTSLLPIFTKANNLSKTALNFDELSNKAKIDLANTIHNIQHKENSKFIDDMQYILNIEDKKHKAIILDKMMDISESNYIKIVNILKYIIANSNGTYFSESLRNFK